MEHYEINDDELHLIEEMAGLFFDPSHIAIALGWDDEQSEFFDGIIRADITGHILYKTYYKGRILAEVQLRKNIKQASDNGSTPAQTSLIDFYNHSKI